MAKFEGIHWAPKQMRYSLPDKEYELLDAGAQVFAVSRSLHYAMFLAFEGIRFFCRKNADGRLEVTFLNWHKNLERFRRSMIFNIGDDQKRLVPAVEELEGIMFIHRYFQDPALRPFFEDMAKLGAQGYLRPFTVDEEQSIGVTFPNQPSIRAAVNRYDRYLGEPFYGVVVPHLVRAVGVNKTGCLKLGVNYLMSVKAVEAAKRISPDATAALFLDDRPHDRLEDRHITEWDSSCCLFAFRDGTVVKIPESDLILPSVTIQGICAILKHLGVKVEERHRHLWRACRESEDRRAHRRLRASGRPASSIAARSSSSSTTRARSPELMSRTTTHPLYAKLAEAREYYWNIYKGLASLYRA